MRKLLLASGLLMINTLLQADAYLLIMSKDDKLCQNITSMFNKDLFNHKEVQLEDHEAFNAVVWDKEFEFYDADNLRIEKRCDNKQSFGCKNAIFDINNDGKDELVAFMDERLFGTPSYNEVSFAPQKAENPFKFQYGTESKYVGMTGTTNTHEYKEFPVQKVAKDDFKFYITSSSHVLLRPFKIADTFYIATFFNTYGRDNWDGLGYRSQDINNNNMVSISKYDATNEQHDFCYMMRIFTSPTFKKTKKDN